jgi:HTH-type transcriptional regulator / antitoxin HipB
MFTITPVQFGSRVSVVRRSRRIRQSELARHAGVSRQWIVALEAGKPTVELGLALRTMDVLGIELHVKLADPPPQWTLDLQRAAEQRAYTIVKERRHRRWRRKEDARLRKEIEAQGS